MKNLYHFLILGLFVVGLNFNLFSQRNACDNNAGGEVAVNGSCVTSVFNTNTNNDYWNSAAGCSSADLDDKWVWFTATTTSTTITYNSANDAILHLFEGAACATGMASVACADNTLSGDETIVYATTIGTVYHVRIQRWNSNTQMNGTICVYDPTPACVTPGNDDACSATALPTPLDGTNCLTSETNCGATSVWSGGCVPVSDNEVWYTATLTGSNNVLDINLSNTTFSGGNVNVQINTKNDACPTDSDMSNFGTYCGSAAGSISFPGLTAGVQYHIGISTNAGNEGDFDVCATESISVTFPDDPCDAVLIADNYCSAGLAHTNVGAVTSFANNFFRNNACGDNNQNEVWFRFTATTNSLDITVTQGTIGGANAEISILETSPDMNDCNDTYGFVDFSCPAWGTTANLVNSLVVGNVYYIAVDHRGNNGSEGTFDICLNPYDYVPPAGSGFTCATAIDINASGLPFVDISTTTGAGNNWDEACDYNYVDYGFGGAAADLFYAGWISEDKFYTYTVPAGGGYYELALTERNNTLIYDNPTVSVVSYCPSITENDWPHTSGLCVGQTDQDGTDDMNSWASQIGYFGDVPCTGFYLPAGTYYFVVDHTSVICPDGAGCAVYDNTSYDYTFELNNLAAASNNECGGAAGLFDGVTESGNNAGCNYSYGASDPFSSEFCALSTENLAWFTFTTDVAATSVTIDLANISGYIQWGVFSGACGGPYTAAGSNVANTGLGYSSAGDPCNATSSATMNNTITGLTPSTQYWFAADGNAGTPTSFDVTISGITVVLPITLLDFTAVNEKVDVLLSWSTSAEINNDYFIIERSFDGENFSVIGRVDGAGNSSNVLNYSMKDFDVAKKGVRYYRLKQVDFNGTYKYFDIVSLKIDSYSDVKLFPNPVTSKLSVSLKTKSDDGDVVMKIYDVTGSLIVDQINSLVKGQNEFEINMGKYSKGLYFISLEFDGETEKLKFLKD